ncbi:11887_t:CDS:2, partial [Racocetra persica]
ELFMVINSILHLYQKTRIKTMLNNGINVPDVVKVYNISEAIKIEYVECITFNSKLAGDEPVYRKKKRNGDKSHKSDKCEDIRDNIIFVMSTTN